MTDYKTTLLKLNNNLNTLREREAKHAGNAPVDLLNQITDHEQAIALTKRAIAGEISEDEWREAIQPLLLAVLIDDVVHYHRREELYYIASNWILNSTIKMRGFDLAGQDLSHIQFADDKNSTWCDLAKANLAGANLTGSNLFRANLNKANLQGAILKRTGLEYASLEGANLSSAVLDGVRLDNAKLNNAVLADAFVAETRENIAKFSNNEIHTLISSVRGQGIQLIRANLNGVKLSGAKLERAELIAADLSQSDLSSADLRSANLTLANLSSASLIGADLRGANLVGTDLTGTNLVGANLAEARLQGANLFGTDLRVVCQILCKKMGRINFWLKSEFS